MKVYRTLAGSLLANILAAAVIVVALVAVPAFAGNGGGPKGTPLSTVELAALNYMREEEKLARDVYLLMYEKWNAVIFTQIADSEQQHMDTMLKMLEKRGLPDPASTEVGVFNDAELQALYNQLAASGAISYIDGLYAGVLIEETDMVDIQYAIDVTTHLDLVTAYQHLLEGSKNHLKAFVSALEKQGIIYEPQLLSRELFEAIMAL